MECQCLNLSCIHPSAASKAAPTASKVATYAVKSGQRVCGGGGGEGVGWVGLGWTLPMGGRGRCEQSLYPPPPLNRAEHSPDNAPQNIHEIPLKQFTRHWINRCFLGGWVCTTTEGTWGNVCPARARHAIPTSAPDLPSHGEAPPSRPRWTAHLPNKARCTIRQ